MVELPNDSHAAMLALSAGARSVLELGSGPGVMTREFAARGQRVFAVEIDEASARTAAAHADDVAVADLDVADIGDVVGDRRFDVVVMGDVLEHLRRGERLLDALPDVLEDGGSIVVSVPNVAHGDVRLMLAGGEWTYRDLGLLDTTHVRFFTRATMVALLTEAGFGIEVLHRTCKPLLETELDVDVSSVPDELIDWISTRDEATTYQFVVRARPGVGHTAAIGPQVIDEGSTPSLVVRMRDEITRLRERNEFLDEAAERGAWAQAELAEMRDRRVVRFTDRLAAMLSRSGRSS